MIKVYPDGTYEADTVDEAMAMFERISALGEQDTKKDIIQSSDLQSLKLKPEEYLVLGAGSVAARMMDMKERCNSLYGKMAKSALSGPMSGASDTTPTIGPQGNSRIAKLWKIIWNDLPSNWTPNSLRAAAGKDIKISNKQANDTLDALVKSGLMFRVSRGTYRHKTKETK